MFNDQLLAGRRILVTGGGTGLGKSMAARFLELGAEVHICGRRKSVCDETATELMDLHGGRVVSHGVDIRNALAVDEMIEAIWTDGPLTDLINNAAGNFISRIGRAFAARLRCGRQHRDARHLLCDACGRPALDRRRSSPAMWCRSP